MPFSDILSSTKPFGSPIGGFVVHYIPSFLVIVLPPSGTVYSFILEVEGYPGQIFGLAVALGLIWLRFHRPDLKRPFKAWLPAVFVKIVVSIALLAAPFFPPEKKPDNGLFYATYAIVGVSMYVQPFPSQFLYVLTQAQSFGWCRVLVCLDRSRSSLARL